MQNPYKHSGKRDTDIMTTEWPIATRDLMQDFQRLEASHRADEVRRDLFSLIAARKALGDAKIAVGDALRYQTNERVKDKLEVLVNTLRDELDEFPLTII